ncbi:MAG: DUF2075 domain-containing protein [Flammeovirgaceae bacterium]|nr:DUF2075 domain-containing protein [Flammeovirgaceae bacterium]
MKLFPEAVMGIFPQSGSYLVPDYVTLLKQENIPNLEELFSLRSTALEKETGSGDYIHKIPEKNMYPVLPMDAWQENALKAVKLGHSLVVQGPPGTGKSQLICNLIADALANKKKILVVCQKRVALDVVYQRLKEHHLSDFLALIHDFKNDRKTIYQKLARQIERIDEYKQKNNSLDSIQMERKFLQTSHRIDKIVEELEEFKKYLFDETECDISIKQLYLRSSPEQPTINLVQDYQQFNFSSIHEFKQRMLQYTHYAKQFLREDYILRDRKSFAQLGVSDLKEIQKFIGEIPVFIESLTEQMRQWVIVPLSWNQCNEWLENENEIREVIALLKDTVVHRYFVAMLKEADDEVSELWLGNLNRMIKDCFLDEGPEVSLPSHQLGAFQKALYQRMRARKSLYGLVRWELFSKDKILLRRVLVANGLPNTKHGYRALEKRLDSRLNLEHNLSKLRKKKWLLGIPSKINPAEINEWFEYQKKAIQASSKYRSLRGVKNILDPESHSGPDFLQKLKNLLELLTTIPQKKTQWNTLLTTSQISLLANHPEKVKELKPIVTQDFDSLCEFDKLSENFSDSEKTVLKKLFEAHGEWSGQELFQLFFNSLALAWIDHIETKHPVLRMVSSEKLQLLENELKNLISEKQTLANDILLMRAREGVCDDLEYNRLNNRVTYRDLLHQVTKKKKIWPVRKLIVELGEEVFRLTPCWLASPESVSAMMPLKELFDVVVFDEASQCFAEKGIPAILRGKQVVVAGDEKQLRPSDIYQVRWMEDETDEPELEIDSLLELSARYLPQVQLRAHYRSQHLELIDFSNEHFYHGKLNLLPDFSQLLEDSTPIEYRTVDGIWSNQTNEAEAIYVAQLVYDLTISQPDKSIGVISFNAPQQMLLLDKIEELFSAEQQPLPISLFVKNIENVQGDEKDIIIFSIGYARDHKGKINVQFGSLNAAGGENRLNVAVTRARYKIIVVASIQPEDLKVDDTKNPGPKLLREYLIYSRQISQHKFTPYRAVDPLSKTNVYLRQELVQNAGKRLPELEFTENKLPFSDVAVFQNNRPLGLVLTDDELYRQSLSAKDPHAVVPVLLEQKKWKFLMTYSRNYWQNPDRVIQEIGKFTLPLIKK